MAQRRRVGTLRYRVIAVSLVCLALLWAVVFVQMATGNDPVLGEGRRAGGAGAQLAETVETTSPEEEDEEVEPIEPEAAEIEAIEREVAEIEAIEAEPEPVPVETAQS